MVSWPTEQYLHNQDELVVNNLDVFVAEDQLLLRLRFLIFSRDN